MQKEISGDKPISAYICLKEAKIMQTGCSKKGTCSFFMLKCGLSSLRLQR